jgi:hypothetical protein
VRLAKKPLQALRRMHAVFLWDVLSACMAPGLVSAWRNPDFVPGFPPLCYAVMALVSAAFLFWTDSFRPSWRFLTASDLATCLKTALLTDILAMTIIHHMAPVDHPLLWGCALLAIQIPFLLVPRCLVCAWSSAPTKLHGLWPSVRPGHKEGARVLWGGDLQTIVSRIRTLEHVPHDPFVPAGILVPQASFTGQTVDGIPLLGTTDRLEQIVHQLEPEGIRPRWLWWAGEPPEDQEAAFLQAETGALQIVTAPAPEPLFLHTFAAASLPGNRSLPDIHQHVLNRSPLHFQSSGLHGATAHKKLVLAHADQGAHGAWIETLMACSPRHVFFLDHQAGRLKGLHDRMRHTPWAHLCSFHLLPAPAAFCQSAGVSFTADTLLAFPPQGTMACEDAMMAGTVWSCLAWTRAMADTAVATGCSSCLLVTPDLAHLPQGVFEHTLWTFAEGFWRSMNTPENNPGGAGRFLTMRIPPLLSPVHGFMKQVMERPAILHGPWHPAVDESAPWISEQETSSLLSAVLALLSSMDTGRKQTVFAASLPVQASADIIRRIWEAMNLNAEQDMHMDVVFPVRHTVPLPSAFQTRKTLAAVQPFIHEAAPACRYPELWMQTLEALLEDATSTTLRPRDLHGRLGQALHAMAHPEPETRAQGA